MKLLVLILCPILSFCQPDIKGQWIIDAGGTTGGTVTARTGVQVSFIDLIAVDGSFRYTQNKYNRYYIYSGSTGVMLENDKIRFILLTGPSYIMIRPIEKPIMNERDLLYKSLSKWGGSFQVQYGIGIFGIEFNGLFGSINVGFALFNPKEPKRYY